MEEQLVKKVFWLYEQLKKDNIGSKDDFIVFSLYVFYFTIWGLDKIKYFSRVLGPA